MGHEKKARGPGTSRGLNDAELQHFVDFGVDLGALGRGDLEGLDRERGVVAGVDVALDTNNATGNGRVVKNIGEFGDEGLGLGQLRLGQRGGVLHVEVLVGNRRRRRSAGRSADPSGGRRNFAFHVVVNHVFAGAVEGDEVPGRKGQLFVRAVGEELGEVARAAGLGHEALVAAHIAQCLGPNLVGVEAQEHKLVGGLVHDLVHGFLEQAPRRVDPKLAAVPTGRFEITVEAERLLKPRLVEAKLGL